MHNSILTAGRLIGYARVSTADQSLDLQTDALKLAGCEKIFTDHTSGAKSERTGLAAAMRELREGDVLVVWKLDRLGRSVRHLLTILDQLGKWGVSFRCISQGFDTATPMGEMLIIILGAIAQFERELIKERTRAGLAAARQRGRTGGRPKKRTKGKPDGVTVRKWCEELGINPATYYRARQREIDHVSRKPPAPTNTQSPVQG